MKYLLSLIILLACVSARAQIVTATVTITNSAGTTNGQTITVNGTTRTWTNNFTLVSSQIPTNSTISGAASNLFVSYITVRPSSLTVSTNSTNAVAFKSFPGSALVVTVSADWATVGYSTNGTTPDTFLRVPLANAGNIERTNVESGLTDYLNDNKATNVISASAPTLSNFVSLSASQTITGDKTLTGANILSNALQQWNGGTLSNVSYFHGSNGLVWAIILVNPKLTNGLNYGNPFSSVGDVANSEIFGAGAVARNAYDVALGNSTAAGGQSLSAGYGSFAGGFGSIALNGGYVDTNSNYAMAVGPGATAVGDYTTAVGQNSFATARNSTAIGSGAAASFTNSTALGVGSATTATNQVAVGQTSGSVLVPGNLQVAGNISNSTFTGSVTLNNELLISRFNNTSLATNNAAVDISTNAYVTINSGPTAAFAIHGIAGGVSGRMVTFENTTGFSMTIANNSGVDPTAANRIKTGLTADYTTTNNPGIVTLRYNGTLSLWMLVSHN